ncbi:hypothetical protein [Streptacidiphilus sp. EB103A]|uniref:hypothetical protein n=1 Tax=Streptacidiphilus sp. EB103A TaxID=3156275 RepID=UPI003516E6E7
MLRTPKQEFPESPAALSQLLLEPAEMLAALDDRRDQLAASLRALDTTAATEGARRLPRITMLESEYLQAVTAAEPAWLDGVVDDLRAGRPVWSVEQLTAFAGEAE